MTRIGGLSLDSGSAERKPWRRTAESVRRQELATDVGALPKHKHWYRTHELAFELRHQFEADLTIADAWLYFAHVNSAVLSEQVSETPSRPEVVRELPPPHPRRTPYPKAGYRCDSRQSGKGRHPGKLRCPRAHGAVSSGPWLQERRPLRDWPSRNRDRSAREPLASHLPSRQLRPLQSAAQVLLAPVCGSGRQILARQ